MAHADDIGKYEGPPCEICRVSQFVGTCTHRPRRVPEPPDFFKDMTGALSDECERLRNQLALVEKMNADNAKMRAVYLDEKNAALLQNDDLGKAYGNMAESYHNAVHQDRPFKGCSSSMCGYANELLAKYAENRKDEAATRDDWQAKYEHVLGLFRDTKMRHGLCEPRSRKACTACNAQEELDKIVKDWKGFTMVLS